MVLRMLYVRYDRALKCGIRQGISLIDVDQLFSSLSFRRGRKFFKVVLITRFSTHITHKNASLKIHKLRSSNEQQGL